MSGTRTTKKKNTSGSTKSTASTKTRSTKKKAIVQQGNGIWDEVRLVVLLLLAVFLFISNFGKGGTVGVWISKIMFGIFGLYAYLFPLVMLFLILFSLANPASLIATVKMVGVILGSLAVSGFLHGFTMGRMPVEGIKEIYLYCSENHTGGGVIGGYILELLQSAFGTIGAYLVLLGVLIICMVIVTEKSFKKGMEKGSRKVYDSAVQDMDRRKELAQERRERRKAEAEERKEQRREERVVSGVTTDVTIQKKSDSGLPELSDTGEREVLSEAAFEKKAEEPFSAQEAVMPEQEKMERAFTFPVVDAVSHKEEDHSSGLEEITFSEDDLLKNALSRRELEAEKAAAVKEAEMENVPEVEKTIPETERPVMEYQYPPLKLLKAPGNKKGAGSASAQLQETSQLLQQVLQDFGVAATVVDASQGPAVTRFEVQPAHGVKVSKIVALADDIKLNLAVADIRIEAPIPGKAAVGIEVPNKENSVVLLRELLDSKEFRNSKSKISFAVGKDIGGNIMVSDIAKMPHVLIAGSTGSGKSVCINTLIMSILYKARPDEVKLIMIDPKVVELSAYNGIPHLLIPVVTDPKKASGALNWAVQEMMGRYNRFAETNVRNIEGYNSKIDALASIEGEKPEKMPQIVVIVDELADLMMVSPGEVEDSICRLAQLARAAGIHLVIATQRPSVNVITGLIKANMPSRIAFAVTSGVDSRTILDMNGAEKLLGKGDMLFSPAGAPKPLRVQGAFVSDAEVAAVVEFLSSQKEQFQSENGTDIEAQMKQMQSAVESMSAAGGTGGNGSDRDALFVEAGKFIIDKDKASIGMLQRWFKIGFNRAARIMDQLADAGVVGEEEGTKPRKVLMSMEQFEAYVDEYV